MNKRAKRIAASTILVSGLAVGAVTFVIKQVQSGSASPSGAVAGVRSSAPASGTGRSSSASSQGPTGRFTGPTVNAYYGYVKVQAILRNGRVEKVVVLKHPNDNGTSRYINSVAMPYLIQEAVQAQGAQISLISGATLSSEAFVKSLGSALAKAGA